MWSNLVDKFKQWWEWYGHADQAWSLYGVISWLFPSGGFMSLMAFQTEMPWPFIVLLGLLAYAIGLSISNQRLWRSRHLKNGGTNRPGLIYGGEEIEIVHDPLDASYLEFGKEITGQGIHEGIWITQKIKIKNAKAKSIHGAQVQLLDVSPLPPELSGRLPLFLKFPDYPNANKVDLHSEQEILVNVVSYHNEFLNSDFHIEEAGVGRDDQVKIFALDMKDVLSFYVVTIHVVALDGKGKPRRFKLWLRDKNIMFQPLPTES